MGLFKGALNSVFSVYLTYGPKSHTFVGVSVLLVIHPYIIPLNMLNSLPPSWAVQQFSGYHSYLRHNGSGFDSQWTLVFSGPPVSPTVQKHDYGQQQM